MSKRQTISQRYYKWFEVEPLWAGLALGSFALSMAGLVMHLGGGWFIGMIGIPELTGLFRTLGLVMLIGFDCSLLAITGFRKQWYWFWFFVYVTIGVIVAELWSYFFGSRL